MKFFLTLLFATLVTAGYSQQDINVLHYKFQLELSDRSDSIKGLASITIHFNRSVDSFTLDLKNSTSSSKKGMTAFVTGGLGKVYGAGFTHKNDKITIIPGHTINKDEERTFDISYSGIPTDGLIISRNIYGSRTFFGDNWPNRAHNWIPCNDDPADKASVEFIVIAPSHYQVISNGIQIEETSLADGKKLTHYKEEIPLPTKVMVIGAADFAVSRVGTIGCLPVYSWVYAENKEDGFKDYAMAKDILAYHINYIGPYPYQKLANVQSKTRFGGMENAGAIFYAETRINGRQDQEELLSHEIIHQWFGDMATEKSFAHLWLSEGFATYLTHLYIGSKYGADSLASEMKEDREGVITFVKRTHKPVVDSTPNYMELLNANSYQKGSWVLHMLRHELGDSVFHASIRKYYTDYAGKNAETSDLQKVFESVSGRNLGQFFKQWLFTPENPNLDITWKYDRTRGSIIITVKQLQQSLFEFPLEMQVRLTGNGLPKKKVQSIRKRVETFEFPVEANPVNLEIDPGTFLLYEGKVTELK